MKQISVAVLLPCHNEATTVKQVISKFSYYLREFNTTVYVYDNCSTDNTALIAQEAGAIVKQESRLGKGFVIKNMFANINADIYLLADGDDTYDASKATLLINTLLNKQLDMVIGKRVTSNKTTFPKGHRFGNLFFNQLISTCYSCKVSDILSGYRAFSYRFIKSYPSFAYGFDTEVDFTLHCFELKLPYLEVPTHYNKRPNNSFSKLRKYKDGFKILHRIISILKETKPLRFFSLISISILLCSVLLAMPIFITYFHTRLVPRLPTAVLVTGLMILAHIFLISGLILDSLSKNRKERKYLHYLSLPWLLNQSTAYTKAVNPVLSKQNQVINQ